MKTFSIFLIIGLFMGQLTFGTGNENCCPDSVSTNLTSAGMQVHLDEVQAESQQVLLFLPSIGDILVSQLSERTLLDRLQEESEGAVVTISLLHAEQLDRQLNSRMQLESDMLGREIVQF
jgi:hypothetical protein